MLIAQCWYIFESMESFAVTFTQGEMVGAHRFSGMSGM